MALDKRTARDVLYSEILKTCGPLSNAELCSKAAEHPHFKNLSPNAIEKDVDRFVKHYQGLGILIRNNGRLEWVAQSVKTPDPPVTTPAQPSDEKPAEAVDASDLDFRHEAVQRLVRGMLDGSIRLKPKSPFWILNLSKGEIYDEFMHDIDLYNSHMLDPITSIFVEMRIFNTALKLRVYGFLEEDKEQGHTTQNSKTR